VGVKFLDEVKGDVFWASLIDQIIVEPSGDIVLLPRLGAPIFIGSEQEVDHQKKNLITFYREQVKTGNLKKYTRIDLSYKDQVIATRYAHLN
jgi:cell division protein FtsQ